MSLRTRITSLLGIECPIIGAAMARTSGGQLAAVVSNAGGFGFMSAGYADSIDQVQREFDIARVLLATPLNIGVGFMCWELEQRSEMVEILDFVLEQRVRAVWFAFGDDPGHWVQYVRDFDRKMGAERTLVFVQVNTVSEATQACLEWEVDVLILQGNEGGGHGSGAAPPLISLLPSVLQAIPDPPPVLAAGGLATGGHLAAMLTLGASGIVLGTRLSTTTESLIPQNKKEILTASHLTSLATSEPPTIRSTVFDDIMGVTHKWPAGITGRGLKMAAMLEDEKDGTDIGERRRRWNENKGADGSHEVIWAGTSVGLINSIESADYVVKSVYVKALTALKEAQSLVLH